jgi:hypothetical protein
MNCENNHLSLNTHLRAMARISEKLVGLPIVAVTGHEDQALNCGTTHLGFDDMLSAAIGVDSCGKPAIRVKFINSCENYISCNNSSDDNVWRQFFAYDASTKTFAIVLNQSS